MLKNIIKELREVHNLTQEDVAKYLHIQRTTYTRYESGTNSPNFDTLCRLADLYNVSTDLLLERNQFHTEEFDIEIMHLYKNASPIIRDIALTILRKGQVNNPHAVNVSRILNVPVIIGDVTNLSIINTFDNDEIVQSEAVNAGDFAVIVNDDSMINANINIGDYAIIRPQKSISIGEIALVNINNHYAIRTVFKRDCKIALVPANSSYETTYCKNLDELRIIGRMVRTVNKKN